MCGRSALSFHFIKIVYIETAFFTTLPPIFSIFDNILLATLNKKFRVGVGSGNLKHTHIFFGLFGLKPHWSNFGIITLMFWVFQFFIFFTVPRRGPGSAGCLGWGSDVLLPGVAGGLLLSCGSCRWTILFLTGDGSKVSWAAGGISPRSIRLRIPFLASSSWIGGGASCKQNTDINSM